MYKVTMRAWESKNDHVKEYKERNRKNAARGC